MRINEITRPPTIEDADKFLRSRGYHRIGYGSFGAVYQKRKSPDQVVKLFTSDDIAYIKYLEMIKNKNNPHFPKIYGNPIKINEKYYAIKQEKLSESVWESPPLFEQYIDALVDGTEIGVGSFLGSKIAEYTEKYPQLEEALVFISNLIKSDKNLMTDIHAANIMMRGDTLVFSDPVATRSALEFPNIRNLPKIHNWSDTIGVVSEETLEKKSIPDQIDGKPTRNSLGKFIHPTVEGIKNFWKWFGDSKVVDAQGRPLVVYHGTPKDIGNPDPAKAVRLPGIWMTPGRKIANTYAAAGVVDAMTYREGANVLPLYAKVENPRICHPRREPVSKAWGDYTEGDFDGFFELQGGGFYAISVPDATQIKSAIGNDGNFSINSNNITEKQMRINEIDSSLLHELKKPREIGQFKKDAEKLTAVDTRNNKWRQNLDDYMRGHDFYLSGSGKYGSVYENPYYDKFVIKVFQKDSAYLRWLKFCGENQNNPWVPKIKSKNLVKITPLVYAVRLEKLERLSSYSAANEFYSEYNKWEKDPSYITDDPNLQKVFDFFNKNDNKKLLDIHGENIMMRGNQIVIIDPFYNWFGKYEPGKYTIDPNE